MRAAIDALAGAGATLVEVEIPFAAQIMAVEFGLCLPEASAYHREMLRERADLYQEDVRTFLQAGELVPATDYITALRVRQKMQAGLGGDVRRHRRPDRAGGGRAGDAPRPGQREVGGRHGGTGDAGLRAPLGAGQRHRAARRWRCPAASPRTGCRSRIQVIGRPFDEATILKVARAYEALTDWTSQAPPI